MEQKSAGRMNLVIAVGLALTAGMAAGCAQKSAETPATVKADMGGNYPPDVKAQAQAYQQQEQQRARQFMDSRGTAQSQRSSQAAGKK
jgi:hypothetical protein